MLVFNLLINQNFWLGFHAGQLFHPLSWFSCAHKSAEVDFAIGLYFSVRFCRRTCQTVISWQWWTVCFRQRIWSWRSNFRRRLSPERFPESSVGGCGWELVMISPNYPGSDSSLYLLSCFVLYCVVGTEERTGRDGAGDVSTGVENESVVRRRWAVVTKRLVPLAGCPSIVFLRLTQARLGVDSCWRRHSMRVYFVPNESYSSSTPRLLHVCDPYFPALDQYSRDTSSSLIQATGHQLVSLCRSVVQEEKNELLGPLRTSKYSGTVPYDSVILWFHHVLFVVRA